MKYPKPGEFRSGRGQTFLIGHTSLLTSTERTQLALITSSCQHIMGRRVRLQGRTNSADLPTERKFVLATVRVLER